MLSQMFTGNLSLFARDTIKQAGRFNVDYGEASLYDLCLRLSEDLPRSSISHIPYALFHRGATNAPLTHATRSQSEDHRTISHALSRRGIQATIRPGGRSGSYPRIRFIPRYRPSVTVVIPTRNAADLLIPCISSLREQTNYGNYSILVIDNQSDDEELLEYLAAESRRDDFDVFPYDRPFNHSEMHNHVLELLESEFVVLLNNDVDGFSSGWLEELVGTTELGDDIAGVGAKLIYPDDTIQHAGMIMGIRGLVAHSHIHEPSDSDGYFGRLVSLQECSGATAALLLLRTSAFRSVSGFDAETFPTSYNDVDLWLRLRQAGYRCIYNPSVSAYHDESKTRGKSPHEDEYRQRLKDRWGQALCRDPFYNISLSSRYQFLKDYRIGPLRDLQRQLGIQRL
jgi:GT2 family glycosyltransferase